MRPRPAAVAVMAIAVLAMSTVTAAVRTGKPDEAAPAAADVATSPVVPTSSAPSGPVTSHGATVDATPTASPDPTGPTRTETGDPDPSPSPIPTLEGDRERSSPSPDTILSRQDPNEDEPDDTPGFEAIPSGTYRYHTVGTTQLGNESPRSLPQSTTLRVSDTSRDGTQSRVRDLRDADGYGQMTAYDMQVTAEAVHLSRVTTTTRVRLIGPFVDTRTFVCSPPGLVASIDDTPGAEHTFTMDSDGTTLAVVVRVLRTEDIEVDGGVITAIVVEQVVTFSGDIEGTSQAVTWLRPDDLLTLREEVEVDVRTQGVRSRTDYVADLVELSPS